MLDTANKNNSELRTRIVKFMTLLERNGISPDKDAAEGAERPVPVTGEVKRVHPKNGHIEITLGSDDGLVVGQELFVFRTKPQPENLGRVSIVTVKPDDAVARVVGDTNQDRKIKEGDIVSSIKPPS